MNLTPSVLELNWSDTVAKITNFIRDYLRKSEKKGVVLGLSGGIDSCTVAALCAHAIEGNKIHALMLPEEETKNTRDIVHAISVSEKLKIDTQTCDITQALNAIYRSLPVFDPRDRVSRGNVKARTRMIYIYYYANRCDLLVCGTSDKSETMMGYFTKWGDVAADISPIMDLYKTQVKRLAEYVGIPSSVTKKPSSPALWPGQTAEEELGVRYEILDLILYGLEHFMQTAEIARQLSVSESLVDQVRQRWFASEHKRTMLLTTKLGYRTVGMDFRLKRS